MKTAAVVALLAAGTVAAQREDEAERKRIWDYMDRRALQPPGVDTVNGDVEAAAKLFQLLEAKRELAFLSRQTWTLRATLVALDAGDIPLPGPETTSGIAAELDYLAKATRCGARPHALPPIRVANLSRATSATLRSGLGIEVITRLDEHDNVHVAVSAVNAGKTPVEPLILGLREGSFAVGLLPGTGARRWLVVMALE